MLHPLRFRLITTLCCSLGVLCVATPTKATMVPPNTFQAGMNAIFSQANFGNDPIAIQFNPMVTLNAPQFLNITTQAQLIALFNSVNVPANTVTMYFVDSIRFCSGPGFFGGCAEITDGSGDGGMDQVIAAGLASANLNAHELGHNLGLNHTTTVGRLMDPNITGTLLTPAEVTAINANVNGIIQGPPGGRFIQITPVHVVPEPASVVMIVAGLSGALLLTQRRRVTKA